MKKLMLTIAAIFMISGLMAQIAKDTTYWKKKSDFTLSFNQVSFSNWAAGGKNSVSGVAWYNYAFNCCR